MNGKITLSNKLKGAVTMANTIINGGASPYPKSASGDIITITDGAENTPLKSAVVNIEPVQDLHGYSYPWPAGGGKNKFDGTFLQGYWAFADGVWSVSSSWITTRKIPCKPSTYYTASSDAFTTRYQGFVFYDENDTYISTSNVIADRPVKYTAQTPANAAYLVFNIAGYPTTSSPILPSDVTHFQIEEGQTKTSFAPYSNICPISGWSEVNVWVKPTYDTSLTPTATISLGQTVYVGYVDALSGKSVIEKVGHIFDGTEPFTVDNNRFKWATDASLKPKASDADYMAISSFYPKRTANQMYSNRNTAGYIGVSAAQDSAGTSGFVFFLDDSTYPGTKDAATFKSDLAAKYSAGTPLTAVYTLATPIEVDLTPQTIKTLLGTNNIWADAGEMSIEYYPAAASIVAVQNRSTKAYVSIPLGMIRYETYQITPQQTIDLDSYRSENGNLLRNPVATKCKLEFNTPLMTDTQWGEIWNIIKAGFNNNTERKLKLKYYDTLSASYKTGYFYVPDVQTTIRNIEEATGTINYNEIRLAFIEY